MSLGDWLKIIVCVAIGYFIIKGDIDSDKRPEYIRYIDDPRNGCVLQSEVPLANHLVHIRKSEYQPKVLRVYACANNNTAATLLEK